MRAIIKLILAAVICISIHGTAQKAPVKSANAVPVKLKSTEDSMQYALGYTLGNSLSVLVLPALIQPYAIRHG